MESNSKRRKALIFMVLLCISALVYCFYPGKKGSIIILDGVSSSGKTSLANHLIQLLGNSYQKIALDDYVADIFLQKKELNLPHKKFIEIIRNRRNNMYHDIMRMVNKGKHVLLDTVLSGLEGKKDVKIAFEMLQEVSIVMILVYCPLVLVSERIEERNERSFFEDKPKEMRSIAATLQFCNVYKVVESDEDYCIGTLSKCDVESAYIFPDFVPKQDMQVFDMVKKRLIFAFDLCNKDFVRIAPRLQYDYIIDTSKYTPEACAEKIYDTLSAFDSNIF